MKINNRLYLLIFIIIFITCNKYNIDETSEHYKKNKDIKSLKILAKTLKKGMLKNEIEKLFGEADYFYKINENTYIYITYERTKFGNSFYVLTIKFNYKDKVNYILTLTSNRGAKDFQKLKLQNGKSLSTHILKKVKSWNAIHKNLGIVFGATQKKELQYLNSSAKNLKILIPGIGAQGGDLNFVVNYLKKKKLESFLINSSRGILYSNLENNISKSINENASKLKSSIDQIYND